MTKIQLTGVGRIGSFTPVARPVPVNVDTLVETALERVGSLDNKMSIRRFVDEILYEYGKSIHLHETTERLTERCEQCEAFVWWQHKQENDQKEEG